MNFIKLTEYNRGYQLFLSIEKIESIERVHYTQNDLVKTFTRIKMDSSDSFEVKEDPQEIVKLIKLKDNE